MKKRSILLLLLLCLLLAACGSTPKNGSTEAAPDEASVSDNSQDVEASVSDNSQDDEASASDDSQDGEAPIVEGFLDADTQFDCTNYIFSCIGAKEYTEISAESYSDTPEEGNVYLVLFLNVKNHTARELYFTPNGFESEVDGKKTDTSFLCNLPEGYSPIFDHIGFHNEKSGFIVWQVPQDWEELTFHYTGLEFSEGIRFSGKITKDRLFDPPKLEE